MERKEPLDLYGREWEATGMIPRGGGDKASLAGTLARAVKPQPGPTPELDAIIKAGELAAAMPKAAPDRFTQTGWTFKDVQHPHSIMERGDWTRFNRALTTNEGVVDTRLPLRSINAAQKEVNPDYAQVPSMYPAGSPLPMIIKKGGQYYATDGHHRLVAAGQQGQQTAPVRLLDLDNTTQTSFPLLDWRP